MASTVARSGSISHFCGVLLPTPGQSQRPSTQTHPFGCYSQSPATNVAETVGLSTGCDASRTEGNHSVSRHPGNGFSIGDEAEWAIPLAVPAVEEPEVQDIGLGSNRRCDTYDCLEITVHAVTLEIALDEGDAPGRAS